MDKSKFLVVNQALHICDAFKSGQSVKFKNELMRMKKKNIALAEKYALSELEVHGGTSSQNILVC